jgi:hypothetical protein
MGLERGMNALLGVSLVPFYRNSDVSRAVFTCFFFFLEGNGSRSPTLHNQKYFYPLPGGGTV